MNLIKLDGNYLEGGGQIARNALALSTLTGRPFEIRDIRKGRKDPGLKAQHLECIKVLKQLCNAETNDIKLGSTDLKYLPGEISAKNLNIDVGTAGSVPLLLQSITLPLAFADKSTVLRIKGGTDTSFAQPFDFFSEIYLPQIKKFVKSADAKLLKRGYYPKGGGELEFSIKPKFMIKDFPDFESFRKRVMQETGRINLIETGKLAQIKGIAHSSEDLRSKDVAERIVKSAELGLSKLNVPVSIRTEYSKTFSAGCGITLCAVFVNKYGDVDEFNPVKIGADCLGEIKLTSEEVGKIAAKRLIDELELSKKLNAPVDRHLADNLVPWLIFGGKFTTTEITNHTKTNVWTTNHFLEKDKVVIEGNDVFLEEN